MIEDNYYVIARKVTRSWFGTQSFYRPFYKYGSSPATCLSNEEDFPTVWGYETEDEAWDVCYEHAQINMEEYCSTPYGREDREDFHSDG